MLFFYRFIFFIIGLFIMTFGVCVTITANLGVGAWDALNIALTEWVGLSIGKWLMIDGAILVIVNSILVKRRPEFLSLLTIILIGSLVDFWMFILFGSLEIDGFILKSGVLLIGIFIIGLGAAIYLQAKFPPSPVDSFMMAIKERFGTNLMMAKTIGEITALLPAIFLKGPIGVGTIIITFAIGPAIQICFPYFERLMKSLSENKVQ